MARLNSQKILLMCWRTGLFIDIQLAVWGDRRSELRRDPAFLRACLEMDAGEALSSESLVPTPSILQDRGLVVQILRVIPSFLRHEDIPSEFLKDRDLFEATVQSIRQEPKYSDVLHLFSAALRNELVLLILGSFHSLRLGRRPDTSFVGLRLRDNEEFCLRAAEALYSRVSKE